MSWEDELRTRIESLASDDRDGCEAIEAAEADPREVPLVDWEREFRKAIKWLEADPPSDPPPSGFMSRPPML